MKRYYLLLWELSGVELGRAVEMADVASSENLSLKPDEIDEYCYSTHDRSLFL